MSITKLLSCSLLFVLVPFLSSALNAGAEEKANPLTPKFLRGGKVISTLQAKTFFDSKEAEFFDTRPDTFGKGRIPGAQPLAYLENSDCAPDFDASVDRFDTVMLPPDKGQTIVFYCSGPNGWKSYKAAALAIKEGYRDVMWFRDGFSGWQAADYPVE